MKKITSKDVAKMAGVSQSTVSFVLNNIEDVGISEITKRKVLEAVKKLNYKPSSHTKNYKNKKSNLFGILTPNLINPFYPTLIKSIEEYASLKGYSIILCNIERNQDKEEFYINLLREKCVDGIIYTFTPGTDSILKDAAYNIPVVLVGEKEDNLRIDTIGLNSSKAGEIVVEHLFHLGHRHIAFISGPPEHLSFGRKRRLEGVTQKIKQLGIEENFIISVDSKEYEKNETVYEIDVGFQLTNELLEKHKNITAIIGVNDLTCIGIMDALKLKGIKIPEDIAVCGFDNTFLSQTIQPRLTTIDHGLNIRAKFAIEMLIDRINNSSKSGSIYKVEFEPELIVRESTFKNNNNDKQDNVMRSR